MTISLETIRTGVKRVPGKALIYGPNGVGKSHMATKFPNPIFLDLEGNINHFDVPKQRLKNWKEATIFLELLIGQEHSFKTLVVDSLDQLEIFGKETACKTAGINNINEGYGKGLVELFSLFVSFRALLDELSEEKKMHIILISHSKVQQIQTLGELTHHKIVPSLNDRIAPLFTDWCNIVGYTHLMLQVEQQIEKDFKKQEIIAVPKEDKDLGSRVLQVESSPKYVAKNVFNFPVKDGKIKLSAEDILAYIKSFYASLPASQPQQSEPQSEGA